jgi:hypothetical protein
MSRMGNRSLLSGVPDGFFPCPENAETGREETQKSIPDQGQNRAFQEAEEDVGGIVYSYVDATVGDQ